MSRHAEPLFSKLQPPGPPPELRRRVLPRARAAVGSGRVPDVWDRLWTSRPVRFAWAAAVLGLAVGNLTISGRAPRSPAETAVPVAMFAGNHGELAELADLGRLTVELPGWEVASAGRGRPTERKEPS